MGNCTISPLAADRLDINATGGSGLPIMLAHTAVDKPLSAIDRRSRVKGLFLPV
jgi:hypothetical protein